MKGVECAVITWMEEQIDLMALIAISSGSQSTVSDTDTGIQELSVFHPDSASDSQSFRSQRIPSLSPPLSQSSAFTPPI